MARDWDELSLRAVFAAAVPLLNFASPSHALELQSLWCEPSEAKSFFVLSERSKGDPEVWIDSSKMQLKETELPESGKQYWLVNAETATFVEVIEAEDADGLSLNGVVNGEVVNTICHDVTTAFLSGLRLSESLILKNEERFISDTALMQRQIDELSEEIEQKSEEIKSLRSKLKESEASNDRVETSSEEIEVLRSNLASLEQFVSLVRADLVTAGNLPSDYVDLFNERYWSMKSAIKE